jgi:hypothetical protein
MKNGALGFLPVANGSIDGRGSKRNLMASFMMVPLMVVVQNVS